MTPERHALDLMARLLAYPDDDYHRTAGACSTALRDGGHAGAAARVGQFASGIAGLPREALQELFTATFDFDPACSLEIGWHLFGENYDRGAFLVEMRDRLRTAGVPERVELPDHLTHVLALLGRLDPPRAAALAGESAGPALARILATLETRESAFTGLLHAVVMVVQELAVREAQGVQS